VKLASHWRSERTIQEISAKFKALGIDPVTEAGRQVPLDGNI
jgi:hypothetical protein